MVALWIEVAALNGSAPHLCKGSFWALQNGHQCGRIFPLLNRPKKVSYCGAVRTPTIFMLFIQTEFPTCKIDAARNFTLAFERPESQQRVSIFGHANHKYDELEQYSLGGTAAGFKHYEKPGLLLRETIALFRGGRIKIKPQQTGVHNRFEPT